MNAFYIIWGMHRSGTSLAAAALKVFGAEAGKRLLQADIYNKRGYFEDTDLINLDEAMLRHLGKRWYSLEVLDEESVAALARAGYIDKAVKYLKSRAADGGNIALKDPRMAILGPIWNRAFSLLNMEPYSLVVWRDPFAVAASLAKRARHIACYTPVINIEYALFLWLVYTLDALAYTVNYPSALLKYDLLLERPRETLIALSQYWNVAIDEKELARFGGEIADLSLRNNKTTHKSPGGLAGKLYEELNNCQGFEFPEMRGLHWPSGHDERTMASLLDSLNIKLQEKEDENLYLKQTLVKLSRAVQAAERAEKIGNGN